MNNTFLKTEPVGKLLISLGLPLVISMLINSLYNIIDSIYVSRLGTEAVTALSIIFPLQNLTIAVSVGLGVGINSVLARFMGAGEQESANKTASVGMLLAFFHFLIFFLLGWFFVPYYARLYAADGSRILSWSVEYGQIVLMVSLPYLLYLVFEKIYQSMGWMKTAMAVMVTSALTNIILDPIMIFGYFGFPAMGVAGAAVATVTGQTVGLLLFCLLYTVFGFPIRIKPELMQIDTGLIKSIYSIGIPAAVTLVLPSLMVGILNSILIAYSATAVAVLGLYYKIQTFFYMPCSGLLQGMRPIIGYNFGAREFKRVRKTILLSFLINGSILAIGFLVLEFFPGLVMDMFAPEPGLREQGIQALRIISIGFIASVVPVVCNGAFEALGYGTQSLIVSLLRQLIFMIPAAFVLSWFFGSTGVWWAFPLSEFLCALVSLWLLQNVLSKLHLSRSENKKAVKQ